MSKTAETMKKRMLSDANKPAGLVPSGNWELRATGAMKVLTEERNDETFKVVLLTHEPVNPSSDVDPDEVAEINPETGRSPFDGARIFTRFQLPRDTRRFVQCMVAHGLDPSELEVDEHNAPLEQHHSEIRGKMAFGTVERNSWTDRTSGEERANNRVKSWASID